jgi:hypothetical protein
MIYLIIPTAFSLGFVVKSGNIVNQLENLEKSFQNASSTSSSGHGVKARTQPLLQFRPLNRSFHRNQQNIKCP